MPCRPDAGVFGLHVHDADPLVALFSHQTVSMKLRDGLQRRHQLHHHPGRTLVVTDLKKDRVSIRSRAPGPDWDPGSTQNQVPPTRTPASPSLTRFSAVSHDVPAHFTTVMINKQNDRNIYLMFASCLIR